MICYMPFTQIEEPRLRMLTRTLGALTVYSPSEAAVPGEMLQWVQQELLEIRHPDNVDQDQLVGLIREYKTWAEMHQGNIGDVAGFFRSRPERFSMMEETNPSQIRHQVRHYGEGPATDGADPVLHAALFLSLAQEFDSHHYAMEREMDAVQALERRMMEQIAGDGADADATMSMGATPQVSSRDQVLSPEMIPQRLRAWALMALGAGDASWLYLTPSRLVVEHILDLFPDGGELLNQPLLSSGNEPVLPPAQIREMVRQINLGADSSQIEGAVDPDESSPAHHTQLTLYRIDNLAPSNFLRILGGQAVEEESAGRQTDRPAHTLIGLVTSEGQ